MRRELSLADCKDLADLIVFVFVVVVAVEAAELTRVVGACTEGIVVIVDRKGSVSTAKIKTQNLHCKIEKTY